MRHAIPGELWNQVGVPSGPSERVNVSSLLSEAVYKISSITDVMMTKEIWHTVCELAERCGSLRERLTATISTGSMSVGTSVTQNGAFQRFIGAGADGIQVGMEHVSVSDSGTGPKIEFDASCLNGKTSVSAYADVSVVPSVNAAPTDQVVPSWFLKEYRRAIMSGTLMRVYAMAGEAWTDETAARMHATTFLREVNRLTHGLITSGMRRQTMFDAESILARQSQTTSSQTTSNTVG